MADEAAPAERRALGERLRKAREYLDLAQEEVAEFLNVPRSAISMIESGQRKVDAIELKKLAKIYQCSVSSLTEDGEVQPTLPEDIDHIARAAGSLSPKDREELARFAEFLKARSKTKDD